MSGVFLQTDPIPGGSCNPYDYACQDPINKYDLNGKGGGAVHCTSAKKCEQRAAALKANTKLPPYFYGCGTFIIFQVCGDLTSHGHLIVTGGVGIGSPGASMGVGSIHDNSDPSSGVLDSYLEGKTLSGGAGAIVGVNGVWGNEGKTGPHDYGGEAGITSPGFGIYESYGLKLF